MCINFSTGLWKMWIRLSKMNFSLTNQQIYYYNNVDLCLEVERMKRTYQPNNHKQSKRLGFFARKKTNVLNRRRRKGRKSLCK